jgi:transposase-like protein
MRGTEKDQQICLNEKCPDYRKKKTGHITKKGFNEKGNQMYKCKTCRVRFPESKGTVFYNDHLIEEQIILICKLLVEKNGIRAIERIMDIHRDTISNLIDDLAKHAREVTHFLITNIGLSHIEVDEMWSFVKKKKRKLTKEMLEQINKVTAGYTSESSRKQNSI